MPSSLPLSDLIYRSSCQEQHGSTSYTSPAVPTGIIWNIPLSRYPGYPSGHQAQLRLKSISYPCYRPWRILARRKRLERPLTRRHFPNLPFPQIRGETLNQSIASFGPRLGRVTTDRPVLTNIRQSARNLSLDPTALRETLREDRGEEFASLSRLSLAIASHRPNHWSRGTHHQQSSELVPLASPWNGS